MFFEGWTGILRVVVVGIASYAALVALLRIAGKRTLAKMNAFDLVVTVALGSTLATIILSKDVALAEGLAAMALLVGLQYLVAWGNVRSKSVRDIAKSEPRLLLRDGQLLHTALRDERVSPDEVRAALRTSGARETGEDHLVILETDGSFSVVPLGGAPSLPATPR